MNLVALAQNDCGSSDGQAATSVSLIRRGPVIQGQKNVFLSLRNMIRCQVCLEKKNFEQTARKKELTVEMLTNFLFT